MSWFAIAFAPEEVARLEHLRLEDEFGLLYLSAGSPRGMSLYGLKSFTNHPVVYLTPEAAKYAATRIQTHGGFPCQEPPADDIILIGGDLTPAHREHIQQTDYHQYNGY